MKLLLLAYYYIPSQSVCTQTQSLVRNFPQCLFPPSQLREMDPFSATMAVVSAVCATVGAINSLKQLHERNKKKKADKAQGSGPYTAEASLSRGAFELSLLMNGLLSKFGRTFGHKLDVRVKHEVLGLRPRLRDVMSDLKKLEKEIESGRVTDDVEKRRKALEDQAYRLKHEMERALTQFNKRIDNVPESNEDHALLPDRPLEFCQGAILCQFGRADARKLSVPSTKDSTLRWGFVCSFCYLEVADYSAIRFSHHDDPVVYPDMLAASHVMACASFQDRRAYYKCLACYENHQDIHFSSAQAFEKHMQEHPGYSFLKVEAEAAALRETEQNITDYVLEPSPEILYMIEADNDLVDGYEETASRSYEGNIVDVSPASSPELAFRDVAEHPVGPTINRQQHTSNRNTQPTPAGPARTPELAKASVLAQRPGAPAVTIGNHSFPSELSAQPSATLSGPVEMSANAFGAPEPDYYAHSPTAMRDARQQAKRHEEGHRTELPETYGHSSGYPPGYPPGYQGYPSPQDPPSTDGGFHPTGNSVSAPPSIRPDSGERATSHASAMSGAPRLPPQQRTPTQQRPTVPTKQQPAQQYPPVPNPQVRTPYSGQPTRHPADDPPRSSASSQKSNKGGLRGFFHGK